MKKIRYVLYILSPETKKWRVSITGQTLEKVAKKMAFNLSFNKDWYTDKQEKRLKMRLVCEEIKGKKIEELEEYKITKNWGIKGYFTNWEKM